MANIAQVWALPSLNLPESLELATGVSIASVLVEPPNRPPFNAILLQTQTSSANLHDPSEQDFRRIGQVLSRLSFSMLCPFQVYSARVVSMGVKEGDPVESVVFPGAPPGIALFESKVGYSKSPRFDPSFMQGPLRPEVENAISWFTNGNLAPNSVHQVLYHWIGLESLAPTVSGSWQCSKCRGEMPVCPHCQAPTVGPKAVRSTRDYLENSLGVSRKEYNSLYGLRCKISHGGLAMDPDGITKVSEKAFRIQELLLLGIKKRLDWPPELPPLIEAQGATFVGVIGLVFQTNEARARFYEQPGVHPA